VTVQISDAARSDPAVWALIRNHVFVDRKRFKVSKKRISAKILFWAPPSIMRAFQNEVNWRAKREKPSEPSLFYVSSSEESGNEEADDEEFDNETTAAATPPNSPRFSFCPDDAVRIVPSQNNVSVVFLMYESMSSW